VAAAIQDPMAIGTEPETPATPEASPSGTATSTRDAASVSTAPSANKSDNMGIGAGGIAGIVAAVVVGIALVAGAAYFVTNRRRKATQNDAFPAQGPVPGQFGAPPGYGGYDGKAFPPEGAWNTVSSDGQGGIGPPDPYQSGPSGTYPGPYAGPGGYGGPPPGSGSYAHAPGPGYNVATAAFGDSRQYGAMPSMHAGNMHAQQFVPPFPQATFTYDDLSIVSGGGATISSQQGNMTKGSRSSTKDAGDPVEPLPEGASIDQKPAQAAGLHACRWQGSPRAL
jgi:hypothetical protein